MANAPNVGAHVEWSWGNGTAEGDVKERFEREVTRTLKGNEVTRHGSEDNPALLIEQESGDQVLKLASEVTSVRSPANN